MIELGHFGLHWLSGVAVLMQGSGPETAIPGLTAEAKLVRRTRCNHQIDLWANADLPDLADPLVQAMLPLPRTGFVPFFDESQCEGLPALARMSSPITPVIQPIWSFTTYQLQQELGTTNVQPLVLTDIGSPHRPMLERALSLSRFLPRPLVLVGNSLVPNRPGMERQTTKATIDPDLPWEAIGATILRRTMLGETPAPN